jgi:hypothetical protein
VKVRPVIRYVVVAVFSVSLYPSLANAASRDENVGILPWRVGSKWVVHVNSRSVIPPNESDPWDVLERQWEAEGKPKGMSFDKWLEEQGQQRKQESRVDTVIQTVAEDSPYEQWMTDDCQQTPVYGSYENDWASWEFEVVGTEKLGERESFKVTATRKGWVDSNGKPVTTELLPGVTSDSPDVRLIYHFDATDFSVVRIACERTKTGEVLTAPKAFTAGRPIHDPHEISGAPHFFFPVPSLGNYDPRGRREEGGDKPADVPADVVAQSTSKLADGRTLVTLAETTADLEKVKTTGQAYAKFFYEKDLPWWTEGYARVMGGVRAKLYSVDGKLLERPGLGLGGSGPRGEERMRPDPRPGRLLPL